MKWYLLLLLIGLANANNSQEEEEVEEPSVPLADLCDVEACQLPDCRCSSVQTPGGLAPRDTPQFVTLTFDDAVNLNNVVTYRELLYGKTNSNKCPARATFYVNHEYTNYQLVNELYNNGMEIALHSISHQNNQTYWSAATVEDMRREFADQRIQMSHFANIPHNEIRGLRIPFLQMTGNATFQVMKEIGLNYDSTWPTTSFINPGLWPYTLDYASTQDCIIPPCPTASVPGVWVTPIISWLDNNGVTCSFVDACFFHPPLNDEDAWFKFILTNFERHYMGTRAPFGFYIHEWYLNINPAVRRALARFLDLVTNLNDAFLVSEHQVIDWVRDPVPVQEYVKRPCRTNPPTPCVPKSCGPLAAEHTEMLYWMQVCQLCPRVYPWLGNHLGQ